MAPCPPVLQAVGGGRRTEQLPLLIPFAPLLDIRGSHAASTALEEYSRTPSTPYSKTLKCMGPQSGFCSRPVPSPLLPQALTRWFQVRKLGQAPHPAQVPQKTALSSLLGNPLGPSALMASGVSSAGAGQALRVSIETGLEGGKREVGLRLGPTAAETGCSRARRGVQGRSELIPSIPATRGLWGLPPSTQSLC